MMAHLFKLPTIIISSLLVFCVTLPCFAQQSNPFELKHRLKKMNIQSEKEISDTVFGRHEESTHLDSLTNLPQTESEIRLESPLSASPAEDTQNQQYPGELFVDPSETTDQASSIENTSEIKSEEDVAVPMPEVLQSKRNLIFGTFIILTLFLTVVISFDRQVVNHIIRAILNDNFMNMLHRDQKGGWSMQFIFLYIFFVANLALFIFLMVDQWNFEKVTANLLILSLILALIFFTKHLSLSYIGSTFSIQRETGQFSFTIMLFNIFLGLLLLPINLFIAFAPLGISNISIYTGLIVIGLAFILRQLRGVFIANRFLFNHQFHFLLYLCTIEIAPILVLIKFFQPYFS